MNKTEFAWKSLLRTARCFVSCLWLLAFAHAPMLLGQEPQREPASEPASDPPVVIEPTEELPVPEGPGKAAPSRPKPPIVIIPRNPAPRSAVPPRSSQGPGTIKPAPAPRQDVFKDSLIGEGEVAESLPGGGYLGLVVEPVQGGGFGLNVVDVTSQSPAWKAGFRIGDRIVGVGGQAVTTLDQFGEQLEHYPVGTPVKFLVQRRGRGTNLTAVLQDRTLAGQLQGMQPGTALPLQPPKTPYQPISPSLGDSIGASDQVGQPSGVMLGVSVSDLSESFRRQFGIPIYRGAAVSTVTPGTTAELAGLQPGDCISEIDGKMILRAEDVIGAMQQVPVGESVIIGYYRGKQKQIVEVPLLTEGMISGEARAPVGTGINPEQLTPQYVESLREEIRRLQAQLAKMQSRLDQLEAARP